MEDMQERWRKFFSSSHADIWTIIEQAIRVASLDHPNLFRQKRGDIAEVLFARNPSGPINISPIVEQQPSVTSDSGAMTGVNTGRMQLHSEKEAQKQLRDHAVTEPSLITQINHIKQVIRDGDQAENALLELLQKLGDMQITANELKVTEIGKEVNALRRHSCQNVRAAAKTLVKFWKFKVDEWVRTVGDDATAGVTSPATLADSPARGTAGAENRLEKTHSLTSNDASAFSTSSNPSWEPTELFSFIERDMSGERTTLEEPFVNVKYPSKCILHGSQSAIAVTSSSDGDARANSALTSGEVRTTPGERGSATRDCKIYSEALKSKVDLCTGATVRPVNKPVLPRDAKESDRPIKQLTHYKLSSRQVEEKLEVAKRKLHEGYQQAENAKKQRTIQVLDFPDLPRTCETSLGKAPVAAQSKTTSKSGFGAQSKRFGR